MAHLDRLSIQIRHTLCPKLALTQIKLIMQILDSSLIYLWLRFQRSWCPKNSFPLITWFPLLNKKVCHIKTFFSGLHMHGHFIEKAPIRFYSDPCYFTPKNFDSFVCFSCKAPNMNFWIAQKPFLQYSLFFLNNWLWSTALQVFGCGPSIINHA